MMLLKLAWRSLWRNRRRTLITLSSIGFGLALSVFQVALCDGIHKQVVGDAVSMLAGHMAIEHARYRDAPAPDLWVDAIAELARHARELPGVERTKTLVSSQAAVASGRDSAPVTLLGVEPSIEKTTSPLAKKIVSGRYLEDGDERGVLIGSKLASRLDIQPGNKLVLMIGNAQGEVTDELLRVTGVFETGADELDGYIIQVPLAVARRVLGLGPDQATQLGIVLRSPDDMTATGAALAKMVAGTTATVRAWPELLPELSGWDVLDRGLNRILTGVVLFLVLFTILNTLLMSVLERTREFAVLLALGTPPATLRAQILVEAVLLGVIGSTFGALIGGAVSHFAETNGIPLPSSQAQSAGGFAVDSTLRAHLTAGQVGVLSGLVIFVTVLVAIYPTIRSTRLNLPDSLRSR